MLSEYQKKNIESCIQTMETACATARVILENRPDTLDMAEGIICTFAWAWANASTGLGTALRDFDRQLQKEEWERQHSGQVNP